MDCAQKSQNYGHRVGLYCIFRHLKFRVPKWDPEFWNPEPQSRQVAADGLQIVMVCKSLGRLGQRVIGMNMLLGLPLGFRT